MVIISSYPASPRRITVLLNFQAILLISSGETSANRDIFFTEDAAQKIFPTSKISAREIRHQFFLIWSNLTIMAHIISKKKKTTGEYWHEVVAVRTERSEVRTKTTEGQYSTVRLEQARSVSSLLETFRSDYDYEYKIYHLYLRAHARNVTE